MRIFNERAEATNHQYISGLASVVNFKKKYRKSKITTMLTNNKTYYEKRNNNIRKERENIMQQRKETKLSTGCPNAFLPT